MQPEVENGCEKAIHAITYGVNGPGIWLDWMRWRQGIAAGFTASSVSGAIAYEVTRYDIGELDRAIADGDARGFVKALTPPGSDRILGVTIVGAHAGDLIAEVILIMKYKLRLNKDPGHHSYLPDLGRSKQVFGRRLAACPCLAAYARLAGALPSLATRGLTRDLASGGYGRHTLQIIIANNSAKLLPCSSLPATSATSRTFPNQASCSRT